MNIEMTKVSNKEKLVEVKRWLARIEELRKFSYVSPQVLECIGWFCAPDLHAIGYETGQLRPGKLGSWDLYYFLYQDFGIQKELAAFVVGLSVEEIDSQITEEEDNWPSDWDNAYYGG